MFGMGPVGTRLPAMTSPAHNHYGYHSPTSSDIGRSRQNSDAMDIQSITEREPVPRYAVAGGPAPWNRNGSPSMSPMYSKYISLTPPFLSVFRPPIPLSSLTSGLSPHEMANVIFLFFFSVF